MDWLREVSPDRVLLLAFAAGVLVSEVRRLRSSIKGIGERVGALQERVAKLEARGDGR